MTQLEDDLRATLRSHGQDIDPATMRSYASIVPRRWRMAWPLLGAAVAVGVVTIGAYLVWPGAERDAAPSDGVSTSTQASPPTSGVDVQLGGDVSGLVSSWSVTDTSEAEPITLTFKQSELRIARGCGSQQGEWRASSSGLFIANVTSWSPRCTDGSATPSWLGTARAFAFEVDSVRLLDSDGATLALLVRDGDPGLTDGEQTTAVANPPNQDPQGVVPATLEPATPERLIGRWTPPVDGPAGDQPPEQPFAEFRSDGTWGGSDGCNGQGGHWAANDQGELLATQGPSTLIGCRGMKPIGGWMQDAVAAGFDGDVLVLLDANGKEVTRLNRG